MLFDGRGFKDHRSTVVTVDREPPAWYVADTSPKMHRFSGHCLATARDMVTHDESHNGA